ncbi:MAG: efflux RND transporter periplasmic adaptor subunit [Gemmataceae bacterium]|nr:efflux RND transporter periplasmic adaptor subunit [Gemmataceae bacterium]
MIRSSSESLTMSISKRSEPPASAGGALAHARTHRLLAPNSPDLRRRLAGSFSILQPRLRFGLLILALAGCTKSNSTTAPGTATPAGAFTVVRPQKKALPKVIDQPGTIQAYESAPLYAKLAGFVKLVKVDIGDSLESGAVLAELSIPELEDEGRQKMALVEQAAAEVEQARKQVVIADADVESADARVLEAKAGLKRAQASFKRWESEATRIAEMVRTKVVDPQVGDETRNQFLAAEAGFEEARARVTVAERAVVKAKAEREKASEDVKATDAKRKVAEAEASRLKSLLEYCFIKAPFAGTVIKRALDAGHFVQPAAMGKGDPLFIVARTNMVRVPIDVPEADAALVRIGVPAKIRVPALHGAEFTGEVKRTAQALEAGSRTLRVEIDLPNAEHKLLPGMYAHARITAPMPEAWALPSNAVVKQADQTVVFLHRDGKAVRLRIQPGRTDGTFTEVFKKEKAGGWEDWTGEEEVLSGPATALTDSQSVQIAK